VYLPILFIFIGTPAFADEHDEPARIYSGLAASVGMLMKASPGGRTLPWCTVILTSPNIVLTAYHCVTSRHPGDTLKVYFPYEGIRQVEDKTIQPFCLESSEPGKPNEPIGCSTWIDDLAILTLSSPYSILRPGKLGEASSTSAGSIGSIAGFGFHDENFFNYGIKHEGNIVLSHCDTSGGRAAATSPDKGRALCFEYDRSKPSETRIAPFDSGGPMFSERKGTAEREIIGVARGSQFIDGASSDKKMAKFVNLTDKFYEKWLAEEVFPGNFIPAFFSIEKFTTDEIQILSPVDQADYTFDIGESAHRLILTLNHEPGPTIFPNNLELLLPNNHEASCERYANVEVCSVENPAVGTYRMSVGWGEQCDLDGKCMDPIYDVAYQMTAIALYDNPSAPQGGNPGAGNE